MDDGGGGDAQAPQQACAACKHQRKKCVPSCPLAPYFPPERAAAFRSVHSVFGVSNVAKRLQRQRTDAERARAAAAMVWEAQQWEEDDVHGAYGTCLRLKSQVDTLYRQLQQLQQAAAAIVCEAQNWKEDDVQGAYLTCLRLKAQVDTLHHHLQQLLCKVTPPLHQQQQYSRESNNASPVSVSLPYPVNNNMFGSNQQQFHQSRRLMADPRNHSHQHVPLLQSHGSGVPPLVPPPDQSLMNRFRQPQNYGYDQFQGRG